MDGIFGNGGVFELGERERSREERQRLVMSEGSPLRRV